LSLAPLKIGKNGSEGGGGSNRLGKVQISSVKAFGGWVRRRNSKKETSGRSPEDALGAERGKKHSGRKNHSEILYKAGILLR